MMLRAPNMFSTPDTCLWLQIRRLALFQWDSCMHLSSCGRVCWCMEKQVSHQIDYSRTGDKRFLGWIWTTVNWIIAPGIYH